MLNTGQKHHYVPKCYLKSFTNSQNNFWKKRNDNGKISLINPSQVCYEHDANRFRKNQTLILNELEDEYYVEKYSFRNQENNYNKIIEPINKFSKEPKLISKSKYELFIKTLLTIKRRNPISKNEIIQSFKGKYKDEEAVMNFFQFLSEETGFNHFTPEIEKFILDYLSSESQDIDRLHDMYLSAFVENQAYTTINQLTKDLFSLKHYILYANNEQEFITSDNPGFLKLKDQIKNLSGFGGEFEFFFPLSPLACLYIKSDIPDTSNSNEKVIFYRSIDSPLINYINKWSKTVSKNLIFALSSKTLESL